jgi:hypothetical protein
MQIPSTIVADISSTTASIINGSVPLIIILFGIGIAFYIIRNLVSFLPKG